MIERKRLLCLCIGDDSIDLLLEASLYLSVFLTAQLECNFITISFLLVVQK
jgi:hypothetical protein